MNSYTSGSNTTLSGAIALNADLTLSNDNSATTRGLVISGGMNDGGAGHSITKAGIGVVILQTTANSYSGSTSVNAGTLTVNSTSNLGSGALIVQNLNAGAGTTVQLNLNNATQSVGSLSGSIATPATGTNAAIINPGTNHVLTVNQTTDGH